MLGVKYDDNFFSRKLRDVIALTKNNMLARNHATRISCGNYFVYSANEIASYCIKWASENYDRINSINGMK